MTENARSVLGVDACKQGWVGVRLTEDGRFGGAFLARTIAELVSDAGEAGPLAVVGIDIPIGLPDSGERQAEGLVRALVGPRASSVFGCPTRSAVEEPSYALAAPAQRLVSAKGLSVQSYGLRSKILDVDAWVRSGAGDRLGLRVVEVHPELSFATMAGTPLSTPKVSWAGVAQRHLLLAGAGIELSDDLGPAGLAGCDDVLDAAAAAWSAQRVRIGHASRFPSPPELFSDGIAAAIYV